MILINSQFIKVVNDEVQKNIDSKINIYSRLNPQAKLIRLDSGDVVRPLAPCVIDAMKQSVIELSEQETFRGRGPEAGYPFLIDAIIKNEYKSRKIKVESDELFVNFGTKDDLGGIGDILCRDIRIAVVDPVYQTYLESNVISNRAGDLDENGGWNHLVYLDCNPSNSFMPELPEIRPDVIYLSYPNDPTGCVMSRPELEKWVKYALKNDALILFDATYSPFITDPTVPRSIYEIKGARRTAIEFRSFSKSGGFTGLHCGFKVIPKEISGYSFSTDRRESLNTLWRRRQQIKSYPPSYVIQRGAEALYTPKGVVGVKENVGYYMKNASLLCEGLRNTRLRFWGGEQSPHIWVESPYESSWRLFDQLIEECNIVSSPGERFGPRGRGYIRLSAFADQTQVMMASTRISDLDI
ncbi:MAG: LL-diaminopimelate aminotransferase [Rikenellaceae bacterium]